MKNINLSVDSNIVIEHAASAPASNRVGEIQDGCKTRISAEYGDFKRGPIKSPYDKTVCGVGFLGEGVYHPRIEGTVNPAYSTWSNILRRCYSEKLKKKRPVYVGCTVAPEWHNFQNFAEWYVLNSYRFIGQRIEIDKDILVKGNKIYGPEVCLLVPSKINLLFVNCNKNKRKLPPGVSFNVKTGKYISCCSNGKNTSVHLGSYDDPVAAFWAYKIYKEKRIKEIAEEYKGGIPEKLYEAMTNYKIEIED